MSEPWPESRAVDAIYLSPHADDAAFSCGAQIHARAARGERVLVVTVFAGPAPPAERLSSFAAHLHRLWGLEGEDVAAVRRAEDLCALEVLGAAGVALDLPDAIYRAAPGGEPLYPSFAALFRDPRQHEEDVAAALAAAFGALPSSPFVAAPLGIGGHVDHRLVHRAARETVPAPRLWLYEDYPYAESWRARRRAAAGLRGWDTRTDPLTGEDVAAKCRALRCYESQLGRSFRGDALERRVRRFVERRGGERLWQPRQLTPARPGAAPGSAAAPPVDR